MKPHPSALWKLNKRGFWKLCKIDTIPLYSMEQLMNKYFIGSVDFLKIDAEGHDCGIILGLVDHCLLMPSRWPLRIQFECNFLTKPDIVNDAIYSLTVHGNYTAVSRTDDDCIMERNSGRLIFSHLHYGHNRTYDQLSKHTKDVYARPAGTTHRDIPRNLFQFWSGEMAPTMKRVTETLKANNAELTHHLFDEHTAEAFIIANFHPRVAEAYRRLIPLAYKCDLFRYCALYINGGIYLDIGYECVNGFKLVNMFDGSLVLDRPRYFKFEHIGVVNACIVSQPRCPLLKRSIEMVVHNVENEITGHNDLYPTGPGLFGMVYEEIQPHSTFNMCLVLHQTQTILKNNAIVLRRYKEYRSDQRTHGSTPYYTLWPHGIYNKSPYTIDISTPFLIQQ